MSSPFSRPSPERHLPAHDELRVVHHGPTPNTDGTPRSCTSSSWTTSGRPWPGPEVPRSPPVHPLRLLPERLPVYRLVGGHVFGHVYTGGIGTILTAWFHEMKDAEDIQTLCVGCGRCREVCPGGIDIPASS